MYIYIERERREKKRGVREREKKIREERGERELKCEIVIDILLLSGVTFILIYLFPLEHLTLSATQSQ